MLISVTKADVIVRFLHKYSGKKKKSFPIELIYVPRGSAWYLSI